MGLDLICNEVGQKCGSYSGVQKIRHLLLCGLKYYVETKHPEEDKLIDYLVSLVSIKNEVQYHKLSPEFQGQLNKLKLDGFTEFIWHSDYDGILTSYDVEKFMRTWNITKDYMDYELKDGDDFYLNSVFNECIESNENICFC